MLVIDGPGRHMLLIRRNAPGTPVASDASSCSRFSEPMAAPDVQAVIQDGLDTPGLTRATAARSRYASAPPSRVSGGVLGGPAMPPTADFARPRYPPPAVRLLIVEDELDLATALATGLRREGYAVDTARRREARERLQETPYDVVCLDLGLPDGDGRDVCRELRAGAAVPGAPRRRAS
jgi:hypothetical protein